MQKEGVDPRWRVHVVQKSKHVTFGKMERKGRREMMNGTEVLPGTLVLRDSNTLLYIHSFILQVFTKHLQCAKALC